MCHEANVDDALKCGCGYRFNVPRVELEAWFNEIRNILETAYLTPGRTPWEQSGKSGAYEDWVRLRSPISDSITAPGAFLDIGCANGFLLECLLDWTAGKGISIEPYGLDYSEKLAALAEKRLSTFPNHVFVGNSWDWEPPLRFDYVRTEICYVPFNFTREYIDRLLTGFLAEGGKLLVAQYRSSKEDLTKDWINDFLCELGFSVKDYYSGFSRAGLELTRVAVLEKA